MTERVAVPRAAGYMFRMETFGAVVVALVLLAIPAFIVLPPLLWSFVKCAPLRVANEAERARAARRPA